MNKNLFSKLYPFDVQLSDNRKLYAVFPWVDANMLDKTLKDFPENGVAVEIGSWTGFSTSLIGLIIKEKKGQFFTIDNFIGLPDIEGSEKGYIKEILNSNIDRLELKDHVTILDGHADEFVKMFDDESIDFMFIDGDHRYSQVSKDIKNWLPKIKPGGILSGHDFDGAVYNEAHIETDCVDRVHHGVAKAVMELGEVHIFKVDEKQVSSIWFINKQGALGSLFHPQTQGGRDDKREEEGTVFESVGSAELAR